MLMSITFVLTLPKGDCKMHFLFLCDLIGLGGMKVKVNEFTALHFSKAAKNQWTKIGVEACQDLVIRFYMNDFSK